MDIEKIKQWVELTQKYQNGKFWEMVFEDNEQDDLMDDGDMQKDRTKKQSTSQSFPIDIYLTDTEVILFMEIPGARKEDIFLSVSGSKLSVKGIVQPPLIHGTVFRNERIHGEFEKGIDLPEPTKGKDIFATFENGLLIVSYPRKYSIEESISIR